MSHSNDNAQRTGKPVKMGMVGGGQGAFIGAVHRMAANLDGQIELVAGCFSRDTANNTTTGKDLYLHPSRVYPDYETMIQSEAALPPEIRMDFVCIVTPNHLHVPVAIAALKAGFHVMSDKPAAMSLEETRELSEVLASTDRLYGLTHTYQGYPLVWQTRHMIAEGMIGKVRKIYVEYPQGWLASNLEEDNKQAAWRTDPALAGKSGCMGDIGSHAHHLSEFVTDDPFSKLSAHLGIHIEGRRLDDDGTILFETVGGATGVLTASQIAVGEENSLKIRVYGEIGGLEWHQMEPNTLTHYLEDGTRRIYRAGTGVLCDEAQKRTRLPAGHPEGYLEAFGNLYRLFAEAIVADKTGTAPGVPGIEAALRGMDFLDALVKSNEAGGAWTPFSTGDIT